MVGVAGAVMAIWPDSGWEPAMTYRFEYTQDSPDPALGPRRWLVTVENDRVTSAILQDPPAGSEYIGSTLPTIEYLLDGSSLSDHETLEVTYEDGIPASFCTSNTRYPDWLKCVFVAEYTPISAEEARLARTWVEPASYSVTVASSSFHTPDKPDWRVFVKDGVVLDSTPIPDPEKNLDWDEEMRSVGALIDTDRSTNPYWTIFWREGDPNPASACTDDPGAWDDEFCYDFLDYEINP